MAQHSVSHKAHLKMLLHCAKYSTLSVCGLLLGKSVGENVVVDDVVPLFHNYLNLAPMLEVALQQTDIYAKLSGQKIIGVYAANESTTETAPSASIVKIAQRIESTNSTSLLVMVDNENILSASPFKPFTVQSGTLKPIPKEKLVSKDLSTNFLELIKSQTYSKLVDFDNHLDNVSLNWLENPQINSLTA
ncbi:ER membrane protein complex subunit 8 [Nowakowskiella sp. JEL0407]|nr:ER membrane protein complex subunit 8 [Nowakowskiella sp. JEL0407]